MTLMTLTENEFKSILPLSVKNNPLVDRTVYDINYSSLYCMQNK